MQIFRVKKLSCKILKTKSCVPFEVQYTSNFPTKLEPIFFPVIIGKHFYLLRCSYSPDQYNRLGKVLKMNGDAKICGNSVATKLSVKSPLFLHCTDAKNIIPNLMYWSIRDTVNLVSKLKHYRNGSENHHPPKNQNKSLKFAR